MLWHILKFYMCFVIAAFFKRTKIKNAHYLQVKGPVILAVNHPNGFMDPIVLATLAYPPRIRYLARGDAFKKGLITTLLESLGIIPIYRIQDGGKEGLKKNDATYERVNSLLKKNKKITIFAEGLCIQERRLRPLKKGVPRMLFGSMETGELDNLIVVPVGINYTDPSQFQSTVFCNVGEPIRLIDYMPAYKESPAKAMNKFLGDLTPRMKELIVHIDHIKSEEVIKHLEEVYRFDYYEKQKLNLNNLEHDFKFSATIVEIINKAEETQEENVRALHEKTKNYFSELKTYNLRDWLVSEQNQYMLNYGIFALRLLVIVITLPLYVRGLLASYLPFKLTHMITKKKVKIIEFKASFNMGIGAVLFLLYYNIQFFVVKALTHSAWWALLFLVVSVLTSMFCLWLSPFRKKTFGILKALRLKSDQPEVYKNLYIQRSDIIRSFEELK
jgi:glycerol-3-phosphate O-acyltransferase/dihydroxyacetone phosphate acyltransferase